MHDSIGFDEIAKKFATISPDVFKKMMGEGVKSTTKKFTELMNRLIELDEQEGKFDEKISCLDSLDELNPGHPTPWHYKGVYNYEQKNYEELSSVGIKHMSWRRILSGTETTISHSMMTWWKTFGLESQ